MTPAATAWARGDSRSHWVLWPTLIMSWIAFAQILSFQGLAIWVVGGSILTALVVLTVVRARRRLLSLLAMVVMTFAAPALAEWLGGDTAGPITRASLMACGVTGAMAVILHTRYPLALLIPSLLLLGGAMGLGAAGSAPWPVGGWAVAAASTAAALGPYRNADLRDRRRLIPFAGLLSLAGVIGIAMLTLASAVFSRPWTIPGSASGGDGPIESRPVVTDPAPIIVAPDQFDLWKLLLAVVALIAATVLIGVVLLLLAAIVVIPLMFLGRQVLIAFQWRRERRRLQRGDPNARAVGAWTWVRLRRARYEEPLPVSASPDVAVRWASDSHEPDVLKVAQIVQKVAFATDGYITRTDNRRVWPAAIAAGRRPRGASLRDRWRWGRRTVKATFRALGPPDG